MNDHPRSLGLATTIVVAISLSAQVQAQPVFGNHEVFLGYPALEPLALGDLDGDGAPDIVVGRPSFLDVDEILVFLNDGNGLFSSETSYAVGGNPIAIAIEDFDGVNGPDLAVVASNETVSILLNDGNGCFLPHQILGVGAVPLAIGVGALDDDPHLDLAVVNGGDDTVLVLFNDGTGTFADGGTFGVGNWPNSVAIGDLDGDTDLDLAVANITDTVSILTNNGDGTFLEQVTFDAAAVPKHARLGDVDGDDDLDLVVVNLPFMTYAGPDTVAVLLNDGSASFAAPVAFDGGPAPRGLVVEDLDGDGDSDIAIANDVIGTVTVLVNPGGGGFMFGSRSFADGNPASLGVADMDGDGAPDLAASFKSGKLRVMYNSGDGTFGTERRYPDLVGKARSVAAGHVNDDGIIDLAIGHSHSLGVSIMFGDGEGGYVAQTTYLDGLGIYHVALAHLNDDSFVDLLARNSSSLWVLLNQTDGTFGEPVLHAVASGTVQGTVAADFDGDLDLDVAAAGNPVTILFNDGAGAFPNVDTYAGAFGHGDPIALDFDGDLDLDLILPGAPLRVLLNEGAGQFTLQDETINVTGTWLVTDDLNGDGAIDLATMSYGPVSVVLNDGAGGYEPPVEYAVPGGNGPRRLAVGDLNLDGAPDLMTSTTDAYNVAVLINQGNGAFHDAVLYSAGTKPRDVIALDADGDGVLDLVAANDGFVSVVANRNRLGDLDGDGVVGIIDFLLLLAAWGPCSEPCPPTCMGDFDGDCDVGIVDFLTLLANWG